MWRKAGYLNIFHACRRKIELGIRLIRGTKSSFQVSEDLGSNEGIIWNTRNCPIILYHIYIYQDLWQISFVRRSVKIDKVGKWLIEKEEDKKRREEGN